jgi:hypothetical protein
LASWILLLFTNLAVPFEREVSQQSSQEKAWRTEANGERLFHVPLHLGVCVITFLLCPSPLCFLGSPPVLYVIGGLWQ